MGAASPASIQKVATLGFNLLLGQFASMEQIGERIALYKATVEAQGRIFDRMSVGVTRSLNITNSAADYERAIETRMTGRRRVARLAQRPDGKSFSSVRTYDDSRQAAEAGVLYSPPDMAAARLQQLRDVGAEYVLLNSQGGLPSLRRFAQEILPAFAGDPALPSAV